MLIEKKATYGWFGFGFGWKPYYWNVPRFLPPISSTFPVSGKQKRIADPVSYIKNKPVEYVKILTNAGERVNVRIVGNMAHLTMWISKNEALNYLAQYIKKRQPALIYIRTPFGIEELRKTKQGYVISTIPNPVLL